MDMEFHKEGVSCQKTVLREVQNLELTQELRMPEGTGDAGKILSAWGQCVLRGKQWQHDRITVSGGVMVRVLYEPEEGREPDCLESWIPFQTEWDLPEECPEGKVRVSCMCRFVDVRPLSAGKMMLRCGVGILAEAAIPYNVEVFHPDVKAREAELLQSEWPVRIPVEMGEKTFHLEETLAIPPSVPQPEKIMYFCVRNSVTDKKVLGSKVVFRGTVDLHMLYLTREGQLQTWDLEIPFSQFADLSQSLSPDAQADVWLAITGMELEQDPEGKLLFQADMTAQYLLDDRKLLTLTEDAYCPGRKVDIERKTLDLPVVLENRREVLTAEEVISDEADVIVDVSVLTEFPQTREVADGVELSQPGLVQVLWYGSDGKLHSQQQRFRQQQEIRASADVQIWAMPGAIPQPNAAAGTNTITVRSQLPVHLQTMAGQGLSMVTGIHLGEPQEQDTYRPSLILARSEGRRLWDIAKENGSTMDAIRKANSLTEEPTENRMLLIPVM